METRETLLKHLNKNVDALIAFYQNMLNPQTPVYELWTAQDVLAHLTFWHESFARNVNDMAHGRKPAPLKGRLADLNQHGVETMRKETPAMILARFAAAHDLLKKHILNPALSSIPYRKGSRNYTPEEHLEIVRKHIHMHLNDVEEACANNSFGK
jgi:hypothetical protein